MNNNKNKKMFLLSAMTLSFLVPSTALIYSCSNNLNSNDNQSETKPDNIPDSGSGENDNSKPQIISEKHSLNYEVVRKAKSPIEIISSTTFFKNEIDKIIKFLSNSERDVDFMSCSSKEKEEEFYKLIQEIGIYGDYGKNGIDKMKYYPKSWQPNFYMQQKYLANFDKNEHNDATLKNKDINNVVLNNKFGFLPSNLSQLFYYLDLKSISSIFDVLDVKEMKMNFDDEKGIVDILIFDKNNKKYLFNYSSDSTSLKKNHDFRQFIYDRSFLIQLPYEYNTIVETNQINIGKSKVKLKTNSLNGTAWVFDRVIDENIPQNYYEFLIGTNMHVLNFVKTFTKDRFLATGTHKWTSKDSTPSSNKERTYNTYWDGGLYYTGGVNGQGKDEIQEFNSDLSENSFLRYEKIVKRSPEKTGKVLLKKPKFSNPDDIPSDSSVSISLDKGDTQIGFENAIDAIWYTPSFKTSNSYMENENLKIGPVLDINKNLLPSYDENKVSDDFRDGGYDKVNGKFTGTISNAGMDFVISKIRLHKDDVKLLLPTLFPLLNTDNEKQWYMGLGDNTEEISISANSTLFSGGYPSDSNWKLIKSQSGRIDSQKRVFKSDDQPNIQSYWAPYDKEKNAKYNEYRGLINWFDKNHFTSPSLNYEQNQKYMKKGMEIQKVLQQSVIFFSNENKNDGSNIMTQGGSGSMIINSRFELVGITFSYIYNQKSEFANIGALLKNYTSENSSLSIIKEIKEKLKSEKISTVKLLSKTN